MINALNTSLSGLLASGNKAAAASSNIANAGVSGSTDPDSDRKPYIPVDSVDTSSAAGRGVTSQIVERDPATVKTYSPNASFSDEDGFVASPNVRLEEELVTLKQAELSYKANVKVIGVLNELSDELLEIFDKEV